MKYVVHWNDGNKPRQNTFRAENDAALEVVLLYQNKIPISLIDAIEQVRPVQLPFLKISH